MVLATAGVAILALLACNGGLLWLYQHSPLEVVVSVGLFIAALALAWLRNRGRQFTVIVFAVQALVVASMVVGTLVGINAGVFTGIFAGGVTLAGLVLLSLISLLYYTGERTRIATALSLGTAIAVVISMTGTYAFLTWEHHVRTGDQKVDPKTPGNSVDFLIERGQYYTGDPDEVTPATANAFLNYTCPESRDEITKLFTDLVVEGQKDLDTPADRKEVASGSRGGIRTSTVTAKISLFKDGDPNKVVKGWPETWTFHLEKRPNDQYWRVCSIDRPA